MKKQRFICQNCGEVFTVEIFEPGEAEEKRIRPIPVKCPKCGSMNVKHY